MNHHFRPDGTCYHVAVYDPADGHFIKGVTHQGYSDSSTWARGQAWAVYGYIPRLRLQGDGCLPQPSPRGYGALLGF